MRNMNKVYIVLALLILVATAMATTTEEVVNAEQETLKSEPPRFEDGLDVAKLMGLNLDNYSEQPIKMKIMRRKATIKSPTTWIKVMKTRFAALSLVK